MKFLVILMSLFMTETALGQCNGVFTPGAVCGNSGAANAPPTSTSITNMMGKFTPPLQLNVPASTTTGGLQVTSNGAGSTSPTQMYYNYFNIIGDTVNTGGSSATSYSVGLLVNHAFGGTGTFGGREAFFSSLTLTAATDAANAVRFYVANSGQGQANHSDGGTIGGGNEKGQLYGGNFLGVLAGLGGNFATGFEVVSGVLNEVYMLTGTSSKTKAGEIIAYGDTDAVQGTTYDGALIITAKTGASAGGKNAILIGNVLGAQPLAATGSVLSLTGSPTIATGIDLSGGTLTTPFKSNGFSVDGSGNVTSPNVGAYSASTWSCQLQGSGGGNATQSVAECTYERIGRLVMIRFTIVTTNLNAPAGNAQIAGLPVNAGGASANDKGVCSIANMAGVTLDAGYAWLSGTIEGNGGTGLQLIQNGSTKTGAALPVSGLSAATTLIGTCTYHS